MKNHITETVVSPARQRPAVVIGLLSLLCAMMAVVLVADLLWWAEPTVWQPLGDYPQQNVVEITDKWVVADGVKCNNDDEPVLVYGTVAWRRVDPTGAVIETVTGIGTDVRQPGCIEQRFYNVIPDEVRAANLPGALWEIVGIETPLDGRRIGVPAVFETESFQLVTT